MAQVSIGVSMPGVSIGINMPVYPQLVRVPNYPVYYAPGAQTNFFFYDGLYWVYQQDNWYGSSWYNGPWRPMSPQMVPAVRAARPGALRHSSLISRSRSGRSSPARTAAASRIPVGTYVRQRTDAVGGNR